MKKVKIFNGENECEIYLIGTAHVSKDSVEEVERVVEEIKPDAIAVELDYRRFISLMSEEKKIDIKEVLKKGDFLKFFVYMILYNFQQHIGKNFGIKPGAEMKRAIELANIYNIPIFLIDRDVEITFSRLLNNMPLKEKFKLLYELIKNDDSLEVSDKTLNDMINDPKKYIELLKQLSPTIYNVLVDERDKFMAKNLFEISKGRSKIVAVVGAGHVEGIIKYLKELENGKEINLEELTKVKNKNYKKIIGVIITALIFAMFFYAIYYSLNNPEILKAITLRWILFTGGFSALGVLLARGKLITAIVAFLSAL
ncbi:TraB family protein [Methanocaldococcus villosus]|uniref:TraB family protein n=1 Tax=Methanocaldococcus villosus TaxID=667126 RepID=UPI000AB206CD|nr:TraB family protein [Methanocaldococcus villosus]